MITQVKALFGNTIQTVEKDNYHKFLTIISHYQAGYIDSKKPHNYHKVRSMNSSYYLKLE